MAALGVPLRCAFAPSDFKSDASASFAIRPHSEQSYRINDLRGLLVGIAVCIPAIVPAICPCDVIEGCRRLRGDRLTRSDTLV